MYKLIIATVLALFLSSGTHIGIAPEECYAAAPTQIQQHVLSDGRAATFLAAKTHTQDSHQRRNVPVVDYDDGEDDGFDFLPLVLVIVVLFAISFPVAFIIGGLQKLWERFKYRSFLKRSGIDPVLMDEHRKH